MLFTHNVFTHIFVSHYLFVEQTDCSDTVTKENISEGSFNFLRTLFHDPGAENIVTFHFLDAIASPSSYLCHWVSE